MILDDNTSKALIENKNLKQETQLSESCITSRIIICIPPSPLPGNHPFSLLKLNTPSSTSLLLYPKKLYIPIVASVSWEFSWYHVYVNIPHKHFKICLSPVFKK